MIKKIANKFPSRVFLKRFAVLFFPVVLLFFLVLVVMDVVQWSTYETALEKKETDIVEDIVELALNDIVSALPAVYEIGGNHQLKRYFEQKSAAGLKEFSDELLMLARLNDRFDQLCFLNERGQEVVKVKNFGGYPRLVDPKDLEGKSNQDFFRQLLQLHPGEFYISTVRLNRENGRIEFPLKPILSMGLPLFDDAGKNRGAIVINSLYARFLQKVKDRNATRADDGDVMVLNRDGYWLAGRGADDEWGFDLGKPDRTFANAYPLEWQQINLRESGIQQTPNGMFFHATVHFPRSSGRIEADYLKIVSYVSPDVLSANRLIRNQLGWIAFVFLILALSTGLVVSNLLNRERTLEIVKKKNAQLGEKTMRLENIINGTRVGTWEWNVQTGATKFNHYWAEMLGYELNELEPVSIQTWSRLTHPEDMKVAEALLEKHFSGKLPFYECEVRMRHKQGRWVWIHNRGGVTQWLPDGKPLMMFGTHQDVSQRKLIENEMEHAAHHDLLTGLPNRVLFEDRLQQILLAAKREQSQFALLFIDLDEFKPVNDNYGHAVGDEVLREAAKRVLGSLRTSDTVARIGGDEFVAILPRIQEGADAVAVAAKMRRSIAEPFLINGLSINVSSSIGIAIYPEDGNSEDDLLKNADSAMYEAKKNGRNQVRLYHA